jgi:hypothetical protein
MFLSPLRVDTKNRSRGLVPPTNKTIETMYIITLKADRGELACPWSRAPLSSWAQAGELATVASAKRSMITRSSNTAPMSSELSKHFGESAATAAHSGVVIAST